jgi:hypothetical protein
MQLRNTILAIACGLSAIGTARSGSADECPYGTIREVRSTEPVRNETWADGSGAYDMRRGVLSCSGNLDAAANRLCEVSTGDDFVVHGFGLPDGTPVQVQALLHAVGHATILPPHTLGYGGAGASFSVGGFGQDAVDVSTNNVASRSFDRMLVVTFEAVVGQAFRVGCRVYSWEESHVSAGASGELTFVLPPGASMTSCYGYEGPAVVPTRATSWGGLKIRYH